MINSCLRLEAILTQLLTETPYVRALTLKGSLREVHVEQHHQCLASVSMTFLMAKLKREEAEKQEQAGMRLAKQKHEIAIRKKELEIQME